MNAIQYTIEGGDLQFVTVQVEPGQAVVGEPGAMMFIDDGVTMNTVLGDGTNEGFFARVGGAFKRAFTGESIFSTVFSNPGAVTRWVAFAASAPRRIMAVDLAVQGGAIICQKGAFLAASQGVRVGVAFKKRLRVGFFGGEGFIMQRLTGWLADQISIETEQRLGKTLLSEFSADDELHREGPVVDAVKLIGERLTKGSKYHYEWYVKDHDSVNAFALPGGRVIVHSGLIAQTESAEELAGVLAHEVQHVELRHSLRQMIHTTGWAAVLTVVLGDVSAITGVLAHQLGNLQYSRTLESEADRAGLHAMARAGIASTGMRDFFARMRDKEKKTGDGIGIALLSSHPATSERLSEIERMAGQITCTCAPLKTNWPAIKAASIKIEKSDHATQRAANEPQGI